MLKLKVMLKTYKVLSKLIVLQYNWVILNWKVKEQD